MGASGWKEGSDTISFSRVYGSSDEKRKSRYQFVDGEAPRALLSLPVLFMPEVDKDEVQFAHVGTISSAKVLNGDVRLEYSFDKSVPRIPRFEDR
jgi:hypothetical protein